MKKTYIIPETLVVDIRFDHTLMAGSPNTTIQNTDAETNGDGDYNDARFFSFDDDDEEF